MDLFCDSCNGIETFSRDFLEAQGGDVTKMKPVRYHMTCGTDWAAKVEERRQESQQKTRESVAADAAGVVDRLIDLG